MSGRRRDRAGQRVAGKGLRIVVMVAALAILGIGLMVQAAGADDDGARVYSNRSIQGKWGFGGNGHGVTFPDTVPAAGVGTMTFDGMGGCMVTSTINVNGTLIGPVMSEECAYTVNPDGTGSSEASFGAPEFPDPVQILFVIVDRGRELLIINVDLFIAGYSAKRM